MLMAAHQHHNHEGESLKDAARERLTSRGELWTDMRESVFEALASFDAADRQRMEIWRIHSGWEAVIRRHGPRPPASATPARAKMNFLLSPNPGQNRPLSEESELLKSFLS